MTNTLSEEAIDRYVNKIASDFYQETGQMVANHFLDTEAKKRTQSSRIAYRIWQKNHEKMSQHVDISSVNIEQLITSVLHKYPRIKAVFPDEISDLQKATTPPMKMDKICLSS